MHRDIKPENLLLDKDGRVKIADFGVAKMVGENAVTGFAETQPAGTPQYMAPEQREHRTTDHRADIYSLGVVLYEMLTGERPAEKLEAPSRRVQVDVRIDEIVLRALEKTPELRFQSATEMRTQVETLTSAPVPPAVVPPPVPWRDPGPLPGTPAVPSRMSRMAVMGACWAPCFLLFALGYLMSGNVQVQPGETLQPAWWQLVLRLTLLPLGIAAPFGTTILGWMAVSRIRRSAGRIHGLPLAVADGVFFPLLLLTGLTAWFWHWLLYDVVRSALIASPTPQSAMQQMLVNHAGGFTVSATSLTVAVLGTLLVRAVWKAVKLPAVPAVPVPASPRSGCGCALAVTGAVILLAVLVMPAIWTRSQRGPATAASPAGFPSAAHIGGNDHSVLVSHADGKVHYVLYYPGDFGSSSSGSQNRGTNTWTDGGSVILKNGRSFGYRREALYPDELTVNGMAHELRQGRVFVLHDDGTMDQLSLPVTVSLAMDPVALGAAIAEGKAPATGPGLQAERQVEGDSFPGTILSVHTANQCATVRARVGAGEKLCIFIGDKAPNWALAQPEAATITVTVAASDQIQMKDGPLGKGFTIAGKHGTAYVAITPGGPVPFGDLIFRNEGAVSLEAGVFTFADIHLPGGLSVPVSVRVQPVEK